MITSIAALLGQVRSREHPRFLAWAMSPNEGNMEDNKFCC